MRSAWRPLIYTVLSTFFVLLLTACGLAVKDPSLFADGDAIVKIALTGPTTVTLGAQSQYAATVSGSSDATVTWSVNGVAGGDTSVGSISSQGLYVAPASAPQSSKVMITATSVASPSVSQSLPVALAVPPTAPVPAPPVIVALSGASSVTLGTSSQYAATVTGSANTDVTWSVNGVAGGNATVGSITASGLYTAPASAPQASNVTITATSVANPLASEGLAVLLTAPPLAPGWHWERLCRDPGRKWPGKRHAGHSIAVFGDRDWQLEYGGDLERERSSGRKRHGWFHLGKRPL